jgi:hypothetical protein
VFCDALQRRANLDNLFRSSSFPQAARGGLVACEDWLFFANKGAVGALEVLSLHANCLSLCLTFYRLIYRHIPLLVQLVFGNAIGKGGA